MRRALPSLLLTLAFASCVAPSIDAPPPRAVPVTVAPPPVAAPLPVVPGAVEPGNWSYAATKTGSSARFGAGGATAFAVECEAANRNIVLRVLRANPSAPDTTVVLRASTMLKSVPVSGGGAFGTARLTARDPILDALAFSRGKFGVSVDGRERWLPAWPEVARVVEDCRS